MKNNIITILFLILIILLAFFVLKIFYNVENTYTKITFFGVGKADSILIQSKSKNILIDTGEKSGKDKLIDKLKDLQVIEIDYLILTHPDKDHIGGASYIVENFNVDMVIQSPIEKNSKAQKRLNKVLKEYDTKNIKLKSDYKFVLENLNCKIYAPKKDYYKKTNDYSIVTLIEDGRFKYLFAADAEENRLKEIRDIDLSDITIYKLPHHGIANSMSQEIIEKISPKYGIITNDRGEDKVLEALEKENSQIIHVFERDVLFINDKGKLILNFE